MSDFPIFGGPNTKSPPAYAGYELVTYAERLKGQTGTLTLMSLTPTIGDATYEVGGSLSVYAYTSGSVTVNVSYTDEAEGGSATHDLYAVSGTTVSNSFSAIGVYSFATISIMPEIDTAITINVAGTFVATYDITGFLRPING